MANEINATVSIEDFDFDIDIKKSGIFDRTNAPDEFKMGIQSVGFASEEVVEKGDVGTIGWCYFENLDATNFVEIGKVNVSSDGDAMSAKLLAGEFMLAPMNATNVYAKADTAAVRLRYLILER